MLRLSLDDKCLKSCHQIVTVELANIAGILLLFHKLLL